MEDAPENNLSGSVETRDTIFEFDALDGWITVRIDQSSTGSSNYRRQTLVRQVLNCDLGYEVYCAGQGWKPVRTVIQDKLLSLDDIIMYYGMPPSTGLLEFRCLSLVLGGAEIAASVPVTEKGPTTLTTATAKALEDVAGMGLASQKPVNKCSVCNKLFWSKNPKERCACNVVKNKRDQKRGQKFGNKNKHTEWNPVQPRQERQPPPAVPVKNHLDMTLQEAKDIDLASSTAESIGQASQTIRAEIEYKSLQPKPQQFGYQEVALGIPVGSEGRCIDSETYETFYNAALEKGISRQQARRDARLAVLQPREQSWIQRSIKFVLDWFIRMLAFSYAGFMLLVHSCAVMDSNLNSILTFWVEHFQNPSTWLFAFLWVALSILRRKCWRGEPSSTDYYRRVDSSCKVTGTVGAYDLPLNHVTGAPAKVGWDWLNYPMLLSNHALLPSGLCSYLSYNLAVSTKSTSKTVQLAPLVRKWCDDHSISEDDRTTYLLVLGRCLISEVTTA